MSLTLISKDLNGVLANPIARARRSPQVGGISAVVVDHTPTGVLDKEPGVIPHPDIFNL